MFKVKQCAVCGAAVERQSDDDGVRFYCATCFHFEKDARGVISYAGYVLPELQVQGLRGQVDFMTRGLPADAKVFELGVSDGVLARALRQACSIARYDGIELSERTAGASHVTDSLFTTPLETIPLDERLRHAPYDLVVMSHVLEHIRDVSGTIEMLRPLTGRTGRLFIEVPNRTGHPAVDMDQNWLHHHSFSATSLIVLLQRHGYETLQVETGAFHDPRYSDSLRVLAASARPPGSAHRPFISDELRRRGIDSIAVWGAGLQTFELLLPYTDASIIACFIDSGPSKQGTVVAGKPVFAPERLVIQRGTVVLINTLDYEREIRERIERDFMPYVKEIVCLSEILQSEHRRAFATLPGGVGN